jgi:hypothetical protein
MCAHFVNSYMMCYCSEHPYLWFAVSSRMYAMVGRLGSAYQTSQRRQEVIFVTFYIGWSESDFEINNGHLSVTSKHWFQLLAYVEIQPRSIRGKLYKSLLLDTPVFKVAFHSCLGPLPSIPSPIM